MTKKRKELLNEDFLSDVEQKPVSAEDVAGAPENVADDDFADLLGGKTTQEPQAAQARFLKHKVILDTRHLDIQMGTIVVRNEGMDNQNRQRQMEVFVKGYNEACDSINHYGVSHYSDLVMKYCKVKREAVDTIPKNLKFSHIKKPREKDIEQARKWLSKK